tara:strand:- start:261 stop:1031 length:771 start_codon:yes stop_codon:yes gene_type:complete
MPIIISSSLGRSILSGTYWNASGSGGYAAFRTGSLFLKSGSASSYVEFSGSEGFMSGAGGTTTFGSGTMSSSSPSSRFKSGLIRADKIILTSNLGLTASSDVLKVKINAPMSASATIEGQISGSSMINHWVVISSGNKNLTAAESGKMIFMAAQTTASLPSPDTIGLYYHIIASQAFNSNPIKITGAVAADDFYGSFVSADGGTNDTANSAYDGIQFTSASVRGDSVTIVSNGSKWFARGVSEKSGAIQYQTGPNP